MTKGNNYITSEGFKKLPEELSRALSSMIVLKLLRLSPGLLEMVIEVRMEIIFMGKKS